MSYRPQVKANSNGTTQDLPIDAETVQGKTPVFTTTNQTIEGVKTYTYTQTFKDDIKLYAESGDSPRLTFQRGTLIDNYNDWSIYGGSDGYLYIQKSGSTGYETRAKFTTTGVDFIGTIKENGTTLADKYAAKSHTHSQYLTEISSSVATSGSQIVNGTTGTTADSSTGIDYYQASGSITIPIGATNVTITPGKPLYKASITSYNSNTGEVRWKIQHSQSQTSVSGIISWSASSKLTSTKNGEKTDVVYFNTINGQSIVNNDGTSNITFNYVDTSDYYNDVTLLCDDPQSFFDNFTDTGSYDNAWYNFISGLGFITSAQSTGIVTGKLAINTSLSIDAGYVYLIFLTGTNTSFKFGTSKTNLNYTAYGYMVVQGGSPVTCRHFSNTTTITLSTPGSSTLYLYFNNIVQYIKFYAG